MFCAALALHAVPGAAVLSAKLASVTLHEVPGAAALSAELAFVIPDAMPVFAASCEAWLLHVSQASFPQSGELSLPVQPGGRHSRT